MLVRTLALALTLVAAAAATEEAALSGSWTATSAERDGAAAPELVGHRLMFDGSAFQHRQSRRRRGLCRQLHARSGVRSARGRLQERHGRGGGRDLARDLAA